jgi:acetyltransferase-like isoleucine patch superfamily enzyme
MVEFIDKPLNEKVLSLHELHYRIITVLWYRLLFKHIGKGSIVYKPILLTRSQNIIINDRVIIKEDSWLLTISQNGSKPLLIIDDGCFIGHFNHIHCMNKLYIGRNVMTADKVYISDISHGYEDVTTPIHSQPLVYKGEVSIGEDTWVGENVAILGCKIGKHCVIGANSVVNKEVPDYSVVVGAPARIIKRYDFDKKVWAKTNEKGEFVSEKVFWQKKFLPKNRKIAESK